MGRDPQRRVVTILTPVHLRQLGNYLYWTTDLEPCVQPKVRLSLLCTHTHTHTHTRRTRPSTNLAALIRPSHTTV